jgi:hypothetical protein
VNSLPKQLRIVIGHEPENTLNFDQTITAELNENINSPITKDEIFKGIKNLKNNKAFGDDQVINDIYYKIIHVSIYVI